MSWYILGFIFRLSWHLTVYLVQVHGLYCVHFYFILGFQKEGQISSVKQMVNFNQAVLKKYSIKFLTL